ncbi:hypothetical protein C2G38_2164433 [Gigaspora rosea]|uniref:Uncharacterized protein n=1 Tax=Gigaspora rosea TaxID=44941 RepID=A0A397W3W6_9GLOM|nr:hypothetical protein C2G38_2164433 [Gigaspora rosea]
MVENENLTPNQVDICDAAAKEWKNIKKFKETRIDDIIKGYLDTPIKLRGFIGTTISTKKTKVLDTISSSYRAVEIIPIEQEIQNNAPAQKRTASSIEPAEAKIKELYKKIFGLRVISKVSSLVGDIPFVEAVIGVVACWCYRSFGVIASNVAHLWVLAYIESSFAIFLIYRLRRLDATPTFVGAIAY